MSLDLSRLNRTRIVQGKEEHSVAPCLAIVLYSQLTLPDLAPALGEALERYLGFIPPGTLRSCWAGESMKKLSPQKIKRDLKVLGNMPRPTEEFYLLYSQGENGAPGTHGVIIFADRFEEDDGAMTNVLRLELPPDSAEGDRLDTLLGFVRDVAGHFPYSVGSVGFGFSYHIFDRFARKQINAMLPRYLGFDASSIYPRDFMKARTPTAAWINLFDRPTLQQLGGPEALKQAVPAAEVAVAGNGVMARAANRPPVGDINVMAPDVGLLPDLARFTQPTRFRMPSLRWADEAEVDQWLARFDTLTSKSWDNR